MKVYLVTSGEYSDYRVCHVFAREEDAQNYQLGDNVQEYEVQDGPVEVRNWHTLLWGPGRENPDEMTYPQDFDGDLRKVIHTWHGPPQRTGPILEIRGWDLQRVRKVYSEQRAQYIARQQDVS